VAILYKTENECAINTMYVMKKSFPIVIVHTDYLMAFGESYGRIYVFYFSFFFFLWKYFCLVSILNSNISILLLFKLDVILLLLIIISLCLLSCYYLIMFYSIIIVICFIR
jgi:hypothetical protein